MRSIVSAAVVVLVLASAPEQGTLKARTDPQPDAQAGSKAAERQRFREMDQDGDGTISRREWRGSDQSFRVHDWNRDGVLSGDELTAAYRSGDANTPDDFDRTATFNDWSAARFTALDRNRDGRLTRAEWLYDLDTFRRVDRNRDGVLARIEFLGGDFDYDRADRFDVQYLGRWRRGNLGRGCRLRRRGCRLRRRGGLIRRRQERRQLREQCRRHDKQRQPCKDDSVTTHTNVLRSPMAASLGSCAARRKSSTAGRQ